MWPVSERFKAAMAGSHTMVERFTVIDSTGLAIRGVNLNVTGGTTHESLGALIRHSTTLQVAPTGDWRTALEGGRVLIERGVDYGDGTDEYVPLMHAHVPGIGHQRAINELRGFDRMVLAQRPQSSTVVVRGGTRTPDAIYEMLLHADPGLSASLMSTEWTSPQLVQVAGKDLAEEGAQMAESIGAVSSVDRLDRLSVAPRPLASNPPVWEINQSDVTFMDATYDEDPQDIPNVVLVRSQHSSMTAPVYGVARDTDPTSPTYVKKPGIGERVWEYETEKCRTTPQAELMAETLLQQVLSGSRVLEVTLSHSMPHIEVGDPGVVNLPDWGINGERFLWWAQPFEHAKTGPVTVELRRGVMLDAA